MKRSLFLVLVIQLFMIPTSQAGFFDNFLKNVPPAAKTGKILDDTTVVKGLKEALATGTERAIKEVAKPDGYMKNELIKILLPAKIQQGADILGKFGFQQQVDDLVLSMNRSAEKAAPMAAEFFGNAIREMSIDDAQKILSSDETAATRFFEEKTRSKLLESFTPVVAKSMEQVGTAKAYNELVSKYKTNPLLALAGNPSLDLNSYVANKALDGLFKMVGEEEKKIRANPAARTTDLLRNVFSQQNK